jgi:hypothetical protein
VVGLDDGSVLVVGNALGLAVGSNVVGAETVDADGGVLRLAGGAVAMGAIDVGREVLNGAVFRGQLVEKLATPCIFEVSSRNLLLVSPRNPTTDSVGILGSVDSNILQRTL